MTVGITELPPEGMQLPGVALAGDAERGTKTTEGISLLFTSAGVTVQGPQPQIERLLVWSALDSATCHEKMQLPDGRQAAIMELTSGGQSIRFLLPSESVSPGQAAYLDQALPTWLVRYKGIATPVAPAPIAPGAEAEVIVALPAPGPNQVAAEAAVQPAPETPAPAYAAAGAAGAAGPVFGAAGPVADHPTDASGANGQGMVTGAPPATMQAPAAPVLQAPPPPAPSAPVQSAPTIQAPPPPPPPPPPPVVQAPLLPPAVQSPVAPAPATGWDDPPAGSGHLAETPIEAKKPKKPKFALTRKQLHAAEAASAGTAMAGAAVDASPNAPAAVVQAPTFEATKAKKPKFALTRKQLHAAEAAAAGTAVTGAAAAGAPPAGPQSTAPPTAPEATKAKKPKFALTRKQLHAAEAAAAGTAVTGAVVATTEAPAMAPPSDPVPLAVQPPPPVAERSPAVPVVQPTPPSGGLPPGDGSTDGSGDSGAGGPVPAGSRSKSNRRNLVLLVVLLVVAVAAGGYLISKKSSSPTTTATLPAPASTAAADTALAGSINLRLADLPSGWTQVPPAQAVVRLPVAPVVAQANAANTMASCLNTSSVVVSGLFASGPLTGQTSLVQSPMFASAAGSSLEMASRTTTMTSPGQVQALNAAITSPKLADCLRGYQTALAQAAVPGATVQTQPVSLPAPTGVSTYGIVSTYTLPGIGTAVVGDAFMLGGRIVTVIHPSTNGSAIPSDVFAPAYGAVASRVAASVTR